MRPDMTAPTEPTHLSGSLAAAAAALLAAVLVAAGCDGVGPEMAFNSGTVSERAEPSPEGPLALLAVDSQD